MKPFLSTQQRTWVAVVLVIVFSVFVAVTTDGDLDTVDRHFGGIVNGIYTVAFGTVPGLLASLWSFLNDVPLIILTLIGGAIYFTFRFEFINFRGVSHAIKVLTGKYDDDDNPGEVTHFQALSTALSATVGLGNIAGVAFAVSIGGPGAVFWMMFAAVFGMASKFAECTLGQMYRKVDEEGRVQGGPMVYLRDGLAEIGLPTLGKYLAVIFAVLCIGASFGGGNMFQANQSFSATTQLIPWLGGDHAAGEVTLMSETPLEMSYPAHLVRVQGPHPSTQNTLIFNPIDELTVTESDWTQREDGRYSLSFAVQSAESGREFNLGPNGLNDVLFAEVEGRDVNWSSVDGVSLSSSPTSGGERNRGWLYGLLMVIAVGLVIVGGIRRIGSVAARIVPAMCVLYVMACLYIVLANVAMLPEAVGIIISEAFTPQAGYGGLVGVLIVGVTRAAFSSEAGIGSAAIAHSAARTKEPVREGFVALLEPAIDTLIVCFMTGIVIVITGVYADPATAGLGDIALTSAAFGSAVSWFPYLLSIAVILFAFSTMISWSYYGERCWSFLFGVKESMVYRVIFLAFIFLGSIASAGNVLTFSDLMLLSMAFPNILGVVLLSRKIKTALESYWDRLEAGEFDDERA